MVCAALNPKIAKAAGENITMKNAKTIKIGEEIDEKYSANDIKHSCKYYKFKVPTDIGNKRIDFKLRNNSDIWCAMNLYNDHEEELATDRINGNSTGKIHLSVKDSEHNDDVVKLTPGQTYYLEVGVLEWDDDYSRDFELSSSTVADDNWGSIEKAPEIKCNTWKKGVLEYDDDVDRYFVKLPKDKKEHSFIVRSDRDITATFEDVNGVYKDYVSIDAYETNNEYREIGRGQRVYIKIDGSEYANYKIKVTSPTPKKTISILKVSKCKKGMKVVKGKTISKANVKVTVNGKAYKTVKSNAKGNFSVKTKKLKAGQKIKVTVSKSGYKTRTSGTIKVKKK